MSLTKYDVWATVTQVSDGQSTRIKRTMTSYAHPDKAGDDIKGRFAAMFGVPESIVRVKEHYPSLTIYQVKRMHEKTGGKFFDKSHMKAHGQRLSDFSVVKDGKGRYIVSAPIRAWVPGAGKHQTKVIFDPETGEFSTQQ